MRAALDDTRRGNQRDLGLLAQLRQRQRTAVAHRRTDLGERRMHVVLERASIRHIGINAFLEGELARATEIIALPVTGTVGSLSPILLVVRPLTLTLSVGLSSKREK